MGKKFLGRTAALLTAVLCLTPLLAATTLLRMSLAQMAGAANAIVRVRCLSASSRWQQGSIWTFYKFQRLETFKGAPPSFIQVRLPGGRVGHILTTVDAVPRFRRGEQGILFLEKTAGGCYAVTAWAEGTFRIRSDPRTGTATVTQDSSAFAVFDARTRRFQRQGVRNLPLPAFRRRLAAAIAQSSSGEQQ